MLRNPLGKILGVATVCLGLTVSALAQDKPKSDKDAKKPETPAKSQDSKGEDKAAGGLAEVGKPAPSFEAKATDGKTYKLADLKDKTVVLEWINRECPVCQKQTPQMKETAAALQKKGVVWLAIDSTHSHTTTDNAEHVKKEGLPYAIVDDAAGTIGKAYGAKNTPTMFVIHKGNVAYSGSLIPQGDTTRNYVTEAVEALLGGKEVSTKTTKPYGCTVKYKAPAANP
jgi:peroxiredoxin